MLTAVMKTPKKAPPAVHPGTADSSARMTAAVAAMAAGWLHGNNGRMHQRGPGTYASLVDADAGIIDRGLFVDDQIFSDEQEAVFTRSWLFVAHESQIPNTGDYFLWVNNPQTNVTGNYTLSLQRTVNPLNTVAQQLGDSRSATISPRADLDV